MQENKNLILAVVLCLVVLFGWGYVSEYMGWSPRPQAPKPENRSVSAQAPSQETQLPVFTPTAGHELTVNTPLFEAVFYTGGGPLRSFILKNYHNGILKDSPLVNLVNSEAAKFAPLGLIVNGQASWSTGSWSLSEDISRINLENGEAGFILNGEVDKLRIDRAITISADSYLLKEKITVTNPDAATRTAQIRYTTAMDGSVASGGQYDAMRLAWDENGSLEEKPDKDLTTGYRAAGTIYWAGPMSTYFLSAIVPQNPDNLAMLGRLEANVFRAAVENEQFTLAPGQKVELEVSYWLGPKIRSELNAVSEQLGKSIDLGMFSGIAKGLLWLLEFFHKYVHNWGIAIILLTVLIKAVFWPLTAKSYSSMEKMKQLQPMMVKLKEKYKDNREALNREMMALYKSYKVNPASGCVPILIQLPVFFGLYQALLTSIALRHASFITYLPGTDIIWLADLSAKDPLYITPIIMGLSMFLQQKMGPAPQDPMQQKIMMFLPLIFTILFLSFPSGLVLYWLMNNILSIFQQWLMVHKKGTGTSRKKEALNH